MKHTFAGYVAACLSTQFCSTQAALHDSVIHIKHGAVQGYPAFNETPTGNLTNWEQISVWKGIPFGASTAGQNRWRSPQPVNSWNGTLDAKEFGNICPNTSPSPGYTIDEDCLSLNVWSAAKSTNAKLPVVMWSYPAYSTAADAQFDGAGMADKEVVFVNYNYRTGALGWLAHPELSEERLAQNGYNSSGNYGMLDQFAALQWVHDNIAAFGGDPSRITVMGQSAGSAATYHIVNSPLTQGLIVGAIIESGVRDPHDPLCSSLAENYRSLNFAVDQGVEYLASRNASSLAEARELSLDDLVDSDFPPSAASTAWSLTATLDHYAMPDTYSDTLAKGAANDVPILTGNTKDESGATYGLTMTVSEYLADLDTTYNATWAEKFLALYPAGNATQAAASYNAQFTDRSKVGTWLWSRLWQKGPATSPVWTYIWDHAPPGQTQGAYHESEITYVLNNLYGTDSPWTDSDYEIAATMNAYWVNFIKTGNPNGKGLVNWQQASQEHVTQRVGNGWGPIALVSSDRLELFENWFDTLPAY